MTTPDFIPLDFARRSDAELVQRARAFEAELQLRRSVRHFSPKEIPREVIELAIRAAGSAPSGAHQQPWSFVVVTDPVLKRRIREAAEVEERENYGGRMGEEWLEALEPLGTDADKAMLEIAPALIVVFRQAYGLSNGEKIKHYYTQESVGIAVGFLLAALHHAGLATLTHTPNPMGFLEEILERPSSERAYVMIPVGFPAEGCVVPNLERKPLEEICSWR